MQLSEALTMLDRLSLQQSGRRLQSLELEILTIAWENTPYRRIETYQEQTVKNKALILWRYLSQLLNTPVNKRNLRQVLEELNLGGIFDEISNPISSNVAPKRSKFYGRSSELSQLQTWIEVESCKLIFIHGMKGIGKTQIALNLARSLATKFDYFVLISLKEDPSLLQALAIAIVQSGGGSSVELETDISIDKAIDRLGAHKCLLILDDFDAILRSKVSSKIEDYFQFFDRINSEFQHSCCLAILGQQLSTSHKRYRHLEMRGLDRLSCQSIVAAHELWGTSVEWDILIEKYDGNPQYLKLIAPTIKDVFNGEIGKFLDKNVLLFDRIEVLIADRLNSLSIEEMSVITHISVQVKAIDLEQLIDDFRGKIEDTQIVKILDRLIRKYLVEATNGHFTLSDLIQEYISSDSSQKDMQCYSFAQLF